MQTTKRATKPNRAIAAIDKNIYQIAKSILEAALLELLFSNGEGFSFLSVYGFLSVMLIPKAWLN